MNVGFHILANHWDVNRQCELLTAQLYFTEMQENQNVFYDLDCLPLFLCIEFFCFSMYDLWFKMPGKGLRDTKKAHIFAWHAENVPMKETMELTGCKYSPCFLLSNATEDSFLESNCSKATEDQCSYRQVNQMWDTG